MIAVTESLPVEGARNRLLRRVDWRFLLPDPAPRRIGCFAAGELTEALELVSDDVVVDDPTDCDLVVVVDPDASTLRRAHAALRPGGHLYAEWTDDARTSPEGRANRLERTGFSDVRQYTPHPLPARAAPERWIPLDASGVVDFSYLGRSASKTWIRRAGRRLQRTIWAVSRPLRRPKWTCAIAVRSFDGRSGATAARERHFAATAPAWEAGLRRCWSELGTGQTPERLHSLLLTGGARSTNKVVALVFADHSRLPELAVKIPRVCESEPMLAREAATLLALQERTPRVPGVPRVLFHVPASRPPLLGETAVVGRRLADLLDATSLRGLARRATGWQSLLAGAVTAGTPRRRPAHLADPVIARFERNFGGAVDPGMLIDAAGEVAALGPLPVVCEQRDFAPWNVLVTPTGEIGVLDWESSELDGLPALDLIYLFTFVSIQLERASVTGVQDAAYRTMLDPTARTGEVVDECFTTYLRDLGLGREILRPLRLLTWMLHSESAYQRLRSDAGGEPPLERLRDTLFVRLWETEMRHGDA